MREIKFRAWDKTEGRMMMGMGFPQMFTSNEGVFGIKSGNMEIMQFTGLYDQRGKEVYERDIVRAVDRGDWRNGEIVWGIVGYFIRLKHLPHIWHFAVNHENKDVHMEIIGNIYENPEMIRR